MQAEMVHIKDELDKTGHELIELRKAKVEHIKIIEDLKVRYSCIVTEYSQKKLASTKYVFYVLYALCLPVKLYKPVQQPGYQWRALFAGQTINKHINMEKFWLC